jgi:hypothetical protein
MMFRLELLNKRLKGSLQGFTYDTQASGGTVDLKIQISEAAQAPVQF